MRKIISILLIAFCVSGLSAQESKLTAPEITFQYLVHDFGNVLQGDKTEYDFHFSNTGKEPLIISDVRSSCGCTVPEWPKNPILPKGTGFIKVKYNSNIVGQINKQVTIISNASNSPAVLKITGSVEKMPTEIIPMQQQTSAPVPSNK